MRLYKNLKSKSSMPLPLDPDPLVELKRVHLQYYVRLNALKTTLTSLNIMDRKGQKHQCGLASVWKSTAIIYDK